MIGTREVCAGIACICCGIGWGMAVFGSDIEQPNEGLAATSTIAVTTTSSVASVTSTIFINEIMVQPIDGEKEWIELYNAGTSTIGISGWTVSDELGVIATASGTITSDAFFVIELEKTVLNNGGDTVTLKHDGEIIDTVVYGNTKAGERHIEQSPGVGNTIIRDSMGYSISHTPTKGEKNSVTAVLSPPVAIFASSTSSTVAVVTVVSSTPTSTPHGLVVINEFVSDPTDNADEFIELFNTGNETVSIDGWYIEDGSETKSSLVGSILPKGFFVIDKPKGALNNSGDDITLYTADGQEVDQVVFGIWDDGNISDNAPAAKDPNSTARNKDGENTLHHSVDFAITALVTKGMANKMSVATTELTQEETEQLGDKKIILNEIFPNPKGSDAEGEFIEIKNISEETVSLAGWKLGDSSKTRYALPEINIKPGSHMVFFRKETKISLNNSGTETIRLFTATGILADSIGYEGSAEENQSFSRKNDGTWAWSVALTPGEENTIVVKNDPPVITVSAPKISTVGETITFDASDTADDGAGPLHFSWFVQDEKIAEGELIQYAFATSGKYVVALHVADDAGQEAKKEIKMTVKEHISLPVEGQIAWAEDAHLILSEAFFDPEGSDTTEEFIELYNQGDRDIDLGGWILDDAEGGSRPYLIPEDTVVGGKQYLVFYRDTTNIALNNTEDAVRLLFPDKTIADQIVVSDIVPHAVYMKNETGLWVWSSQATPGDPNIFIPMTKEEQSKKIKGKDGKIILKTAIDDIKDHENGDVVMVQGTVAVKPGVFGTTIFYIVDRAGIQVTMPKKQLPAIDIGDRVEIVGILGDTKGERRIAVKKKEDVQLRGVRVAPETPKEDIGSIGEERVGSLLMIAGEVVEVKGNTLYIDDGSGEMLITFPKGVKANWPIKEGDIIEAAGIVRSKTDTIYLMPRMSDDMQKIGTATSTAIAPTVEEKEKNNSLPYILVTGGGIISIGSIFFARKKMKQ